jgi:hypothetical protein
MAANRRKARSQKAPHGRREPGESRTAEALTIAWTVSVTGVLIADLMVIGAHFLARGNPQNAALRLLEGLLLLSAAVMGAVSLVLFVAAWRTRQLKPPQGYAIFAALVAAAPIAATLVRLL